jgi:hypothetical protein
MPKINLVLWPHKEKDFENGRLCQGDGDWRVGCILKALEITGEIS